MLYSLLIQSFSSLLIMLCFSLTFYIFFFNDTATTEIYTLSLHDALPISDSDQAQTIIDVSSGGYRSTTEVVFSNRSEEHTSELQSRQYLVCRLLLEKKKKEKDEQ